MPDLDHASYMSVAFDVEMRSQYIPRAVAALKWLDERRPFACLAVTGISGVTIGSILAHATGKRLMVIRKPDDMSTHSYRSIEGFDVAKNGNNDFVLVDDLIDTGRSLARVLMTTTAVWLNAQEFHNSFRWRVKNGKLYSPRPWRTNDQIDNRGGIRPPMMVACLLYNHNMSPMSSLQPDCKHHRCLHREDYRRDVVASFIDNSKRTITSDVVESLVCRHGLTQITELFTDLLTNVQVNELGKHTAFEDVLAPEPQCKVIYGEPYNTYAEQEP